MAVVKYHPPRREAEPLTFTTLVLDENGWIKVNRIVNRIQQLGPLYDAKEFLEDYKREKNLSMATATKSRLGRQENLDEPIFRVLLRFMGMPREIDIFPAGRDGRDLFDFGGPLQMKNAGRKYQCFAPLWLSVAGTAKENPACARYIERMLVKMYKTDKRLLSQASDSGMGIAHWAAFHSDVELLMVLRSAGQYDDVKFHLDKDGNKWSDIYMLVMNGAKTRYGETPLDIFVRESGLFFHIPERAYDLSDTNDPASNQKRAMRLVLGEFLLKFAGHREDYREELDRYIHGMATAAQIEFVKRAAMVEVAAVIRAETTDVYEKGDTGLNVLFKSGDIVTLPKLPEEEYLSDGEAAEEEEAGSLPGLDRDERTESEDERPPPRPAAPHYGPVRRQNPAARERPYATPAAPRVKQEPRPVPAPRVKLEPHPYSASAAPSSSSSSVAAHRGTGSERDPFDLTGLRKHCN
jgi:hypothetical protein